MKRLIAAFAFLATSAFGGVLDDSLVYSRAVGSVVWICSVNDAWKETTMTGVVIGEGEILTALTWRTYGKPVWAHPARRLKGDVINDPKYYRARDKEALKCWPQYLDSIGQLVVFSVLKGGKCPPPARMAADDPAPGQEIFTIGGTPSGVFRVAEGSIRGISDEELPRFFGLGVGSPPEKIRVRTFEMASNVEQGDWGGPIFNRSGELVGVVLPPDSSLDDPPLRGVSISEVRRVLAERKKKSDAEKAASDRRLRQDQGQ